MDRQAFLWELRTCLNGRMPPAKIEDIIAYYEEYFAESGAEGETAVMTELGEPRELAARILGAEPAWEAPPNPWETDGFTYYSDRQRRRRGLRGGMIGLVCAVLAIMIAANALGRVVTGRNLLSPIRSTIYGVAVPEPTLAPAAASAMIDAYELGEHARLAPFTALDLNLSAASVEIYAGSEYSIDISGSQGVVRHSNGPDGLRVWDEQDDSADIATRLGEDLERLNTRVVITVPDGTNLTGDVTLHNSLGFIDVSGLSCRNLTLESGLGSMNLFNITAETIGLTLSGGELYANNLTAREAKVTGALGAVDLNSSDFGFLSVELQSGRLSLYDCRLGDCELRGSLGEIVAYSLESYGLRVFAQSGSITLSGALRGVTEVTQSLGKVSIMSDLAESEYSYDLQTSLGAISVDGRSDRSHVVKSGDAPNRLTVQNSSGSIEVYFWG